MTADLFRGMTSGAFRLTPRDFSVLNRETGPPLSPDAKRLCASAKPTSGIQYVSNDNRSNTSPVIIFAEPWV